MTNVTRYAPRQGGLQIHYFDNATDDDIMTVAPAVFADAPSPTRTKQSYQMVNTGQLIHAMREEGWQVTAAGQKFVRDMNRWAHARHFIRLRHADADVTQEYVPEAVIMNAHDGTASWKYFDGAFRFVCANGLVWGEIMGSISSHHTLRQSGSHGETAMRLSQDFMRLLPKKMRVAEKLKETQLTEPQMYAFFASAISVRWPTNAPLDANDLATYPWLKEDYGLTAWQVYNHAQRVLVTLGGVQGRTASGRSYVAKPIGRVDETVRINTGLWDAIVATVPGMREQVKELVAA